MIAGTRAIPGFHITWTPDSAVVSPSGDFGYTYATLDRGGLRRARQQKR